MKYNSNVFPKSRSNKPLCPVSLTDYEINNHNVGETSQENNNLHEKGFLEVKSPIPYFLSICL